MKNYKMEDLKNVPLDALLRDLTGSDPEPSSPVDMWLESAQIHPGTTRVRATDLYQEFVAWHTPAHGMTGKILGIRLWGREMARRFQRQVSRAGSNYFVSRQSEPTIPKYLLTPNK